MIYYGKTDKGIVRSENQDTFSSKELKLKCMKKTALLALVCDGMGGALGGSRASSIACDSFMSYVTRQIEAFDADISKPENIPFEKILRDGVKFANKAVLTESTQTPEYKGMGTTLVAILVTDETLYTVNVGDSRMYALDCVKLVQISRDHSFVQSLVDNGTISAEQAKTHPEKNIILRAVGTSASVEPDIFVTTPLPDAVLLCSDGLSNMVSDEKICEVLSCEKDIEEKVSLLVDLANNAGGSDNITAFAATFEA